MEELKITEGYLTNGYIVTVNVNSGFINIKPEYLEGNNSFKYLAENESFIGGEEVCKALELAATLCRKYTK